jgi:hypothetical protein
MIPNFASFEDFWPYYLGEHARPATRTLHIAGSLAGLALLILAAILRQLWLVLPAILVGYGLSWLAHFRIERNRPATFRHPLWSLRGDFRMLGLWATGRLDDELRRHRIGLS